jgi:mannitol-1-/sugar-/sorbitol-6-phosphatase
VTSAQVTADAGPGARVSAILFDLDGVLVDSLRVVERAWRRWAREHGLPADEVLAVVHGRVAREVIGMFTPHLDAAEQAVLVGGYETQDGGELSLLPGASECVGIARQGRWAVVTSGSRALATTRLAAVGLPVPEILVTADDVTFGKPDPEPYRRAAAALGVPEAECVVVEDAPMGILAAKRAGMTVLAVTTTHAAAALSHADLVFPGMADVSGWLGARARAGRGPRGAGPAKPG